ncbi:hypothetical protein OPV22_035042 [Ensete ventricosum]|uniref:AIPP2-like SPOC-like domain-containing protein n=1 Tax=Ensete ventricosum TaxID=4639 RepID=A0AAV8PTN2_ENSVE|nr:hypothetical protein OPV22_035042 [Ensete ventricosum]
MGTTAELNPDLIMDNISPEKEISLEFVRESLMAISQCLPDIVASDGSPVKPAAVTRCETFTAISGKAWSIGRMDLLLDPDLPTTKNTSNESWKQDEEKGSGGHLLLNLKDILPQLGMQERAIEDRRGYCKGLATSKVLLMDMTISDVNKEMSKASVAYDASENVVISPKVILDEVTDNKLVREETSLTCRSPFSSDGIKTSDLYQRNASDIAEENHREECHTKNDLHISGFTDANSAIHVYLEDLHKKVKECSPGLTDSSPARTDIEEIQNEAAYDCSTANGILSRSTINDEKSPILGKYVVGEKDDIPDEVSKEDGRKSRSQLVSSKDSDECLGTETDDNSKFQPRDTIKCRATNEQADKQFNQVPPQPNSECESSAEIEADILSSAVAYNKHLEWSLEELLAFCSRCSDGAEHIYCMRVRLDTVPESEWVCEECRLKEAQTQMVGKFGSQLEAIEAVCSSENSQSIESTSNSLPGVENKAVDLGTRKDNKELDELILSIRTEEKFDVTEEKISEACGASTGTTVSRNPTLLACDSSINKSDLVKVKLPALVTSCGQSEGISRSGANAQTSSYSNSYKLQTHFELTKGSLSKSVSFNKSKMPKVKQLLENIPHKQKMTREYSLSSMRKGGPSRTITKSTSFRSESSGFSNASTVGDMQLPIPPPYRPFISLSVAATSVSSVKVAPKVLEYEATPKVMLDPSKLSNNRGSKEATKFANEVKQLPTSPISQTSGSTSSIISCKNEDQKPLHHGAELIHKDDKMKDHTFLSNIRQAASVDNRLARCRRSSKWKDAVEIFTLEPGTKRPARSPDQSMEVSMSSANALDLVKKFPCKVQLEEVPCLSAWLFRSHENSPNEDNIALFFFAKDTESYGKCYLNLLEDMLKNDLALLGNIDAVELLILPSNLLPANSQCWNKLFYLWGVFRGRNISCFTDSPDLEEKPSVSSLNLEPKVQDQSIPDFSGLCSSHDMYDKNSQELSRFYKFAKAKASMSSSCTNIQDFPTSGNKDRILYVELIPPVQNLHLAVAGDKVLTEQTSRSCSASCPYTSVSQLPNVPVAYPEPKLQIDLEQLPVETENDLTDLDKLVGDSDSSEDSEHHANVSSTSISEEPILPVLFNCRQGNARNVQKIKQKREIHDRCSCS